jgi:hypothetical protein
MACFASCFAASRFFAVAAILAGLLQGLCAEPRLAQRLLGAALGTLATGQKQAPVAPDAPFRDAVHTLIYGQGTGGAF